MLLRGTSVKVYIHSSDEERQLDSPIRPEHVAVARLYRRLELETPAAAVDSEAYIANPPNDLQGSAEGGGGDFSYNPSYRRDEEGRNKQGVVEEDATVEDARCYDWLYTPYYIHRAI